MLVNLNTVGRDLDVIDYPKLGSHAQDVEKSNSSGPSVRSNHGWDASSDSRPIGSL